MAVVEKTRPASVGIPALWVRLLSKWRHGVVRSDWSVPDFYYALARLGGHQNRQHDRLSGWLVFGEVAIELNR